MTFMRSSIHSYSSLHFVNVVTLSFSQLAASSSVMWVRRQTSSTGTCQQCDYAQQYNTIQYNNGIYLWSIYEASGGINTTSSDMLCKIVQFLDDA